MLEMIAFIAGTAALTGVSRASLRVPGSHGFYRFIAWELMLVLVVYNIDGWYDASPTPDQIASGICMGLSLLLVVTSFSTLLQFGHQGERRTDATLLEFEKTTVLVTSGIYRRIRHPMYSSLIFLDWGLFFKQMSWLSGMVALVACLFLVSATLAEERENVGYFGDGYRDYMKRSKRYIPFLF
jgi:protein-S-isoprenylcysteine O-methyltransferase Ste14